MTTQLYNVNYLQETQKLLADMKRDSYQPLLSASGKIADIGCGVGMDAINIASLVDDTRASVVGVDVSPEMISQARSAIGNRTNITFLEGNTMQLPFSDGELSGLRNERLIQHLADPEGAFAEFYRVMKNGAPVVIVETDWTSISFYNGNYSIGKRLKHYMADRNVTNGGAAANLIHYLGISGFTAIDIRLLPLTTRSFDQCMDILRIDHALGEMKSKNVITDNELSAFLNAWREADRHGHFLCAINLVIVTATK